MKLIATVIALSLLPACCATCPNPPAATAAAPAAAKSDVGYTVIPLRFAVASDVALALRKSVATQPNRRAPQVIADERTNSVIVSCAPDELAPIQQLIAALDVEVKAK
jgi:type II secretory pathway component GspD/PulD (secretin)